MTTSLDTNWDPAERWRDPYLSAAIAQCDLLLPNEAEALALSGAGDPSAAALALASGGTSLAVKLGARGALCVAGRETHQVSLPPVAPVDTTGAGDCFNAGLIAGLLQGLPLPRAAALGCAAGALSTGALGGTAGAPGLTAAQDLAKQAMVRAVGLGQNHQMSGLGVFPSSVIWSRGDQILRRARRLGRLPTLRGKTTT